MTMLKTENLVILFTDIAGFTEATSLQSRAQNQQVLERHNSILLPIVKRFRGRHIKSIGDALLLAFRSPTDGMRCAMAMQDAMHEYNLKAAPGEDIHIRVAASLGEVRVTRSDIFGEPVNVTSRIEGITPADEIYFSEAVYLAMNKAEVPAVEIGLKELKGISKQVRIFAIPRFAQTRLIAEPAPAAAPADPRVSFPFGGMHLTMSPVGVTWIDRMSADTKRLVSPKVIAGAVAAVIAGTLAVTYSGRSHDESLANRSPVITAAPSVVPTKPLESAPVMPTLSSPTSGAFPVMEPVITVALPILTAASTPSAAPPAPLPVLPIASDIKAPSAIKQVPAAAKTTVPKKPSITTIIQAKQAYKARRIDKIAYRAIVQRIEAEYEQLVRKAKLDYKAGALTKDQYRSRIIALKLRYIGET